MTPTDTQRDEQPASGRGYTPARVIAALRKASGIASGAAKDLDCSRKVVMDYISNFPQIQAAYDELREESVDMAEDEQLKAMGRGDRWAIENWLFNSKQGRARGWLKHAERLADAGLLNAIQIVMPHNERDDVAVSVQQFDAPIDITLAPFQDGQPITSQTGGRTVAKTLIQPLPNSLGCRSGEIVIVTKNYLPFTKIKPFI